MGTEKNIQEGTEKIDAKHTDMFRWGKENMIKKLGTKKTASWLDAKDESGNPLLTPHPDSLTGKTGEWDLEYDIPKTWWRLTIQDLRSALIGARGEASNDALDVCRQMRQVEASRPSMPSTEQKGLARDEGQ